MSLAGLRVGIVADRKGVELAAVLERGGAEVTWGPTMTTVPPEQDHLLVRETADILAAAPTWVAISTGSGLRAWLEAAGDRRDDVLTLLRGTCVAARGAKSNGALRAAQVRPAFVSAEETMDSVVAYLAPRVGPADVVAVQVHGGEVIGTLDVLRPLVRGLLTVAPYRWVLPADRGPAERLVTALVDGRVDVLAATSAPTVRNLVTIAAGLGAVPALLTALRTRVAAAAVGPVTARAFEELRVPVSIMPARARTGDLVRAIGDWERPV